MPGVRKPPRRAAGPPASGRAAQAIRSWVRPAMTGTARSTTAWVAARFVVFFALLHVYLWRHISPLTESNWQMVSGSHFDSDRLNLFVLHRIEEHLTWLADRGIYSWGFQGFNIKRTVEIMPHNFPADKYEWYVRTMMARLAPYYNVVWNNTWEAANGAADFKDLTQNQGMDP